MPPASTNPASKRCGPRAFRCSTAVALRDQVVELTSTIAGGGDSCAEQCWSKLHAREMNMHFPEAGEQRFSFGVNGRSALRDLD